MILTRAALNRTLLLRQGLLERRAASVTDTVRRLVGLQAQEGMSPYLGLAARLDPFDPYDVTRGLEDRSLVRLLTMRGTVHLLDADDALALRGWTAPVHEREVRVSASIGTAREVDRAAFLEALSVLLADGPRPQRELGAALAERFPAYPATQLGQLTRSAAPLVQCPPRGTWKGGGAVVYADAERWVGRPAAELDVGALVRRWLAAYGPATAADLTTWSGVTRLATVLKGLDLVRHEGPDGEVLHDVEGGELADADTPAPVRLLGQYDNLWLSHAGRDRVTTPQGRAAWSGPNGGLANTVFVDGWLSGLWKVVDGRVQVIELLRELTPDEEAGFADEVARVDALLAT